MTHLTTARDLNAEAILASILAEVIRVTIREETLVMSHVLVMPALVSILVEAMIMEETQKDSHAQA